MVVRKNELAVVTGATSGIGRAYAEKLGALGYDLIITGRRADVINPVAEAIRKASGVNVEVVLCELADLEQADKLAEKLKALDNLTFLVNNAGFGTRLFFHEENPAGQEDMVKVHVLAAMKLMRAALPSMVGNRRGAIVNMSSVRAFTPSKKAATYSGTKAFLNFFTESIHVELMGTGVKVQALCPGFTRSDFHTRLGVDSSELKSRGIFRWMTGEEVVEISLKALEKGRVIVVPGFGNKLVTLLPRLIPRKLYYYGQSKFQDKR